MLSLSLSLSLSCLRLMRLEIIKNDIIAIGDGYTDYEIKKYGLAKYFIAYTNHIKRDNVIKNADINCKNFNEVIQFCTLFQTTPKGAHSQS